MFDNLPTDYKIALDWAWEDWQPYYETLQLSDPRHLQLQCTLRIDIRCWHVTCDGIEQRLHVTFSD
ncbi:MAG: hypothetical protein AAF846_28575, partial [Chloroflexota bacterium]